MHIGLITPKLQFIISLGAMKQGIVGCQGVGKGGGVKRFVAGGRGQFKGICGVGWVNGFEGYRKSMYVIHVFYTFISLCGLCGQRVCV